MNSTQTLTNRRFSIVWWAFTAIILIFGGAWIWINRVPEGNVADLSISAPQKGFIAPDFTLKTNTGKEITLSKLKGSPVVINFWASWCKPCQAEMPSIERVYSNHKNEGLIILGVNTSNQDKINEASAFAEKLGLTFPILYDIEGKVSYKYQVRALPTTFFIDRNGIITDVTIGGPMSEALIESKVKEILSTKP